MVDVIIVSIDLSTAQSAYERYPQLPVPRACVILSRARSGSLETDFVLYFCCFGMEYEAEPEVEMATDETKVWVEMFIRVRRSRTLWFLCKHLFNRCATFPSKFWNPFSNLWSHCNPFIRLLHCILGVVGKELDISLWSRSRCQNVRKIITGIIYASYKLQ